MGRADRRSPSTSTPSSLPRRRGRREYLLCWLMASGRFGCHDISRHRWGGSTGWEGCCFGLLEGVGPVTVVADGVVWLHCTRVGCYWTRVGGTSGRWGLRAVDTTLGQWIPTLVEQVDSGPLLTGPASNHDHRAPAQATGRGRWGRTCDGGAGLCRTNHGLSLLRGLVSTVLTLASPASARSAGIVGILRFLLLCAVPIRVNVSAVDTHTPSCLVSRPPSPPGPPACPRFLPERVSQKS